MKPKNQEKDYQSADSPTYKREQKKYDFDWFILEKKLRHAAQRFSALANKKGMLTLSHFYKISSLLQKNAISSGQTLF